MSLRDKLIEAIRDEGWTCEYHEPDSDCEACQWLHARTLDAVLDTLEANADELVRQVPREGLGPIPEDVEKIVAVLREDTE